ncbi:hypothetical protein SZN_27983, partial [Streptomyces zinciresistens K42]
MSTRTEPSPAGTAAARPPLVRELPLVAGLFVVCGLARRPAAGRTGASFRNADRAGGLERALRLPATGPVQNLSPRGGTLVRAANTSHATVRFPATVAFLGRRHLLRPAHCAWASRALTAVTSAAPVAHPVFPLAPPRMPAATGLIDTGGVHGPSVYGPSVYGSSATDQLPDQSAAMPSLHVGRVLTAAVGLIAATRTRWRWPLPPVLTPLVVVGTAKHHRPDAI